MEKFEAEVIVDVKVDENGEAVEATDKMITSITNLKKANAQLAAERDKLDLKTKEGVAQAEKLNQKIKENTKIVTDNSQVLEKQKETTASFSAALDMVVPGLGKASFGIQGMTKAAWAFVANPIGLIILALVTAFAFLKTAISGSEDALDAFDDIASIVGSILEVLVRRVGLLGEALIALFKGDLTGAINKTKEAFSGVGDEISRNIDLTLELNKQLRDLEDAQNAYALAASKTKTQIDELLLQAKNRTKTEEERIALTQKALEMESKLRATELANAEASLDLLTQKEAKSRGLFKLAGETSEEFAERAVTSGKLTEDSVKVIIGAYEKLQGVRQGQVAFEEKVQNQLDKLEDAAEAKRIKREEAEIKRSEEARAARIAALDLEIERRRMAYALDAEYQKTFAQDVEVNIIDGINRVAKIREDQKKKALAEEKKAADAALKIEMLKNDGISFGINKITKEKSVARAALNTVFKADAIKETVTNTYAAAVAAYKSLAGIPIVGPVLGAAAAAAVAAFGLYNVGRITGVAFARGGQANKRGTAGGNLHSNGGTRYYGEDGHTVELERDENWYVLKRSASEEINRLSAINEKHGGVAFGTKKTWYAAQGGQIETRQAARLSDVVNLTSAFKSAIRDIKVVTYIEDVEQASATRNEIIDNSTVLS